VNNNNDDNIRKIRALFAKHESGSAIEVDDETVSTMRSVLAENMFVEALLEEKPIAESKPLDSWQRFMAWLDATLRPWMLIGATVVLTILMASGTWRLLTITPETHPIRPEPKKLKKSMPAPAPMRTAPQMHEPLLAPALRRSLPSRVAPKRTVRRRYRPRRRYIRVRRRRRPIRRRPMRRSIYRAYKRLHIKSTPAGAKIYINGRFRGKTPSLIRVRAGRSIRIKISKPCFISKTIRSYVKRNRSYHFRLVEDLFGNCPD